MSSDKLLAANAAAALICTVTPNKVKQVSDQYLAWLDAQPLEATAIQALLDVSGDFAYPETTIAKAALALVPTITGISPATGVAAGGTATTVTGTNLTGVTALTFGGTAGTSRTPVSDTSITVTSPAHAAGAVNVVVTTPTGVATLTAGFLYT